MRFLIGLAAAVAVGTAGYAADTKYTLNGDNTTVEWTGTKKGGKHVGGFKKVAGSVTGDGDPTKAKIDVSIDTDSLYSDDAKLTGHLKGGDFFDVKSNPTSTFKSTKIEKAKDDGVYTVTGDLTLNGKTKSVSFPAKVGEKDGVFTLTADFNINRTDFGMKYGAGMIDDDVALKVSVKAKK